MTPTHANQMSCTAAVEYVRQALQAQEHESLSDAAHRVIEAYLHGGGLADIIVIERALVAYSLRLDEASAERAPMKWAHVFESAAIAKLLLERIERLTCECGHQHHGACPESDCECMAFLTKEADGFRIAPEAKVQLKRVAASR